MSWVKIDDHFDEHPKMAAVGPEGWGIWLAGLAYCNRNLTDGFIPASIALRHGERGVALMVDGGLWEPAEGGYNVHDYHDFQPSKAEVLATRECRREAGRSGGLAKGKQTASKPLANVYPVPVPVPVPVPDSVSGPAPPEEKHCRAGARPRTKDGSIEEAKSILAYLNDKGRRNFSPDRGTSVATIRARLREGYTADDLRAIVDNRVAEWLGDEAMAKYLRPETLFNRTKAASYLEAAKREPGGCTEPITGKCAVCGKPAVPGTSRCPDDPRGAR